jgi:hypothetical protein
VLARVLRLSTAEKNRDRTKQFVGAQDSPGLDKNFRLVEGAIHHTYASQGWRIRAAFLPPDGPAARIEHSKIIKADVNATIQDYELGAGVPSPLLSS